jgi:hypothetical protein
MEAVMAKTQQHNWVDDEHDGVGNRVQKCRTGTCTVRKVENCSTFWQRDKGGHWRDVEKETIPPCTGLPVGRRPKRTPAGSSSP